MGGATEVVTLALVTLPLLDHRVCGGTDVGGWVSLWRLGASLSGANYSTMLPRI